MGHRVRDVDEERFVSVLLNERDGFIRVASRQVVHVRVLLDAFLVAVEIDKTVIARRSAKEVVEPLVVRHQFGNELALAVGCQVPFSKTTSGVACCIEHFG